MCKSAAIMNFVSSSIMKATLVLVGSVQPQPLLKPRYAVELITKFLHWGLGWEGGEWNKIYVENKMNTFPETKPKSE